MTAAERTALLQQHNLPATSWIYGSPCRPLLSSWFRVEGATLIHQDERITGHYTYVVVPARMTTAEKEQYELVLISRPPREQIEGR